jgi:hypothetical protein
MENAVAHSGFEHHVALSFCGAGDVASAARIVECQLEYLAAAHLLEAHFRARPVERTFDAPQIEADGFAARIHACMILTITHARESAARNR